MRLRVANGGRIEPGEIALTSLAATRVRLCIYDASGIAQAIDMVASSTGPTCAGKPCWREIDTPSAAIRYRDKEAAAGAITVARLRARRGMLGLSLKARGPAAGWSGLPATPPVTAQLIVGDGAQPLCWDARFATVHRNDTATLKVTQP
jgi:hypothetical protein